MNAQLDGCRNAAVRRRAAVHVGAARSSAVAAAGVLLVACASPPDVWPKMVKGREMLPFAIIEECIDLKASDRLDYDFTATQPVRFDIRYQDKNAVVMPVSGDPSTGESGRFTPIAAHNYCARWEAGASGAFIDYQLVLRPE